MYRLSVVFFDELPLALLDALVATLAFFVPRPLDDVCFYTTSLCMQDEFVLGPGATFFRFDCMLAPSVPMMVLKFFIVS